MKNTLFFIAVLITATLISCSGGGQNRGSQTAVEKVCVCGESCCSARSGRQKPAWLSGHSPDMHTSEMSLDFFGTYEGVLPSASGEGVRTVITLSEDRTFVMTREYLGREDNLFEFTGNYTIEFGEIVVLDLGNEQEMFFDLREGSLALLDNEMNRIENEPFQPRYQLMMRH